MISNILESILIASEAARGSKRIEVAKGNKPSVGKSRTSIKFNIWATGPIIIRSSSRGVESTRDAGNSYEEVLTYLKFESSFLSCASSPPNRINSLKFFSRIISQTLRRKISSLPCSGGTATRRNARLSFLYISKGVTIFHELIDEIGDR